MPFGVCDAPWLITEMAHKTSGSITALLIYMDDLCVLSATWESHLKSLESMFAALQAADLTLKPSKPAFGPKSVEYLGHVISAEGVALGKDRIKAIQELPTPTSIKAIKDLRPILGVMNFVRRFVPNFAEATGLNSHYIVHRDRVSHAQPSTEHTHPATFNQKAPLYSLKNIKTTQTGKHANKKLADKLKHHSQQKTAWFSILGYRVPNSHSTPPVSNRCTSPSCYVSVIVMLTQWPTARK